MSKVFIILFTLAAVGVGSIWAASYSTRLVWKPQVQEWRIVAWTHDGQAYAVGILERYLLALRHGFTLRDIEGDSPSFAYRVYSDPPSRRPRLFFLTGPVWAIAVASVSYPVMFMGWVLLRRYFRRRRRKCLKCGYDLTGNVSGRCPECGELIPPNMRVATARAESRFAQTR